MFPVSTHQGQAVMGFPDVCKTPLLSGGSTKTPIAYPNIGSAGIKSMTAQQLQDQLNSVHHQLLSMTSQDATRWHALVDQYVLITADLYKRHTPTKTATVYKTG